MSTATAAEGRTSRTSDLAAWAHRLASEMQDRLNDGPALGILALRSVTAEVLAEEFGRGDERIGRLGNEITRRIMANLLSGRFSLFTSALEVLTKEFSGQYPGSMN